MRRPAILAVTAHGRATARRCADALGGELHGLAGRVDGVDVAFARTADHLRALFAAGRPIVAVAAAGIVVRALAPLLADKRGEPPVVVVAEDGSVVVPLLGGHRGANALARALAEALGAVAAVTTAGDLAFAVALDEPPDGWALANPGHHEAFAAELLAGTAVRLDGEAPWLAASGLPFADDARLTLRATDARDPGAPDRLVYHPKRLAIGVGCERDAPPEAMIALVHRTLDEAGLAPGAVAGLWSLDLKADEPAVHASAAALGVTARFFDAVRLEAETPRLASPSEAVFRAVGCHGVAEAAALAAAGPGGCLAVAKRRAGRATCAVARSPAPIDPASAGLPRGRLALVGLGPGDAAWRTGEAGRLLAEATDLVGFAGYLDLVAPLPGQARHPFPIGAEDERCRVALDLAAAGRSVALVCSGDPGIYAMAALVLELLDADGAARPDWRRAELVVAPGISALQAAAARAGAPLGHDFCAISLSDLLTPWPLIRRRVAAAAEADFVIAFYNPVSARRQTQLAEARELLLAHRPADTPCVVARNLGRPGERVAVVPLAALDPAAVDMTTLVLVGASTTRRTGDRVYTPRGYATKTGGEDAA